MNSVEKKNYKILLIDDDEDILEMLSYNLEQEGYQVRSISQPQLTPEFASQWKPQLILLDIMMPEIDGIELCRRLREISILDDTFIIFLTARSEEYTQVAAFENGADAFIAKPIRPRALLSRINGIFQRRKLGPRNSMLLRYQGLTLDRGNYQVSIQDQKHNLAKKEFDLLYFLMKNNGRVLSREEILANVWGSDVLVSNRTVDVHIRKIREKIGENYVQTVKSVGYKFTYLK